LQADEVSGWLYALDDLNQRLFYYKHGEASALFLSNALWPLQLLTICLFFNLILQCSNDVAWN
jgi:hypothetical protein